MAALQWHKIAESLSELETGDNNIAVVDVPGKKICVALHNNECFAFAYKCPHASGIMANGFLDATGHIVCPLHRYRFSIRNGRNTSGEGYYLKTYPIETREDGVYVGIASGSFFGL